MRLEDYIVSDTTLEQIFLAFGVANKDNSLLILREKNFSFCNK